MIDPHMKRAITVFFGSCLLLGACTQRMICPAYQSAFIYDQNELRKKFSYFQEDSTPKVYTASKNKFLIAEPTSYQRKIRAMQTVKMKPVPVVVPDSLTNSDSVSMADLDRAARSVIDSTFIKDVPKDSVAAAPQDSVYVITKDKELRLLKYNAPDSLEYDSIANKYVPQTPKYYVSQVRLNIEQDNYMWYLRDALVLPDVKLAGNTKSEGEEKEGKETAGKKKGGFFKNLFRKKHKEEVDSASLQPPPADEFDYVESETDTTLQAEIPQPKPLKEKKGLFGKKKNKDKAKNPQKEPARKTDAKKEDDDGF